MVLGMFVVILLQANLVSRVQLLGARPNLALVLILIWSMQQSVTEGMLGGFLTGFGLDLVSGMTLGTSSLSLMICSLLGGVGTKSVFANNVLLPLLAVTVATPLHGWTILLTQQLRGQTVDWLASTVRVIGPETLLNMALALILFPLLRYLGRALGAARMDW
jgi:rod shape-determining protein MreD